MNLPHHEVRVMEVEPGIAFRDQHHAEAIAGLRKEPRAYLVQYPIEEEECAGVATIFGGDLMFLVACREALDGVILEALFAATAEAEEEEK